MSPIEHIPPEILAHILSFVGEDQQRCISRARTPDYQPLLATSLVARAWTYPSQTLLFSVVCIPEDDPRPLKKWVECPVKTLKTRVLVLGGQKWKEPAARMVEAVRRCKGLEVLCLGRNAHVDVKILCLSSLAGLKSLTLASSKGWTACERLTLPFSPAELTFAMDFESQITYSAHLLASFLGQPNTALHSLFMMACHSDLPAVLATFPSLASRLTTLRFHLKPRVPIIPLLSLCTSPKVYQSDDLWWECHSSATADVLNALPPRSIDTIMLGNEDHPYETLANAEGFFRNLAKGHAALEKVRRLVISTPCIELEKNELRRMARGQSRRLR